MRKGTKCKTCGGTNLRSGGTRPVADVGEVEYWFCRDCKKYFKGDVRK